MLSRQALRNLCVITLFAIHSLALGQQVDADARRLARIAIAAHRENRQRLHSGVYRASGTHTETRYGEKTIRHADAVELYCAFDKRRDLFRFDRKQIRRFSSGRTLPGGGHFVRTPKLAIIHGESKRTPRVSLYPPSRLPRTFICFDISILGSAHYYELESLYKFGMGLESLFNEKHGVLATEKVVAAERTPDGAVKITWIFGQGDSGRRTMWLDSAKGYSPIRLEEAERLPGRRDKSTTWSSPINTAQTEWKQISGAWVPVKAKLLYQTIDGIPGLRRPASKKQGIELTFALTFEWISVNKPPDAKNFSIDGFGIKNPIVVDYRHGKQGIILQHPSIATVEEVRIANEHLLHPDASQAADDPAIWYSVVAGVTIGAIFIALLSVQMSRRRSRERAQSASTPTTPAAPNRLGTD